MAEAVTKTIEGFYYQAPEFDPGVSGICNDVLRLAAMGGRLAQEERTLVEHPDGRPENVAEHSHMLARIAPIIAMRYYPELDPGLVALYATIHDDIEAYVRDTPTHEISAAGLLDKEELERRGLEMLKRDYADIPEYAGLVENYEEQTDTETRFVKALDKLLPYAVHFNEGDDGRTLKSHWSREELLANAAAKAERFRAEYPEFPEIIDVRMELVQLAVKRFYPD